MQPTDETGQGNGLTDQASALAGDAAAAAQEKASELRDQGSMKLRDEFDHRSTAAGGQVRSLAQALRRSSGELSRDGNSGIAHLSGEAAQGLDRVGVYLEQKRADDVMRDLETFARRQPWLLAGAGMLAGAATARFLKASSVQRSGSLQTNGRPARSGLASNGEARPVTPRPAVAASPVR